MVKSLLTLLCNSLYSNAFPPGVDNFLFIASLSNIGGNYKAPALSGLQCSASVGLSYPDIANNNINQPGMVQ